MTHHRTEVAPVVVLQEAAVGIDIVIEAMAMIAEKEAAEVPTTIVAGTTTASSNPDSIRMNLRMTMLRIM